MDNLVMELMQEGKDVNETLNMPFHYVVEILRDKNEPKKSSSFFDLL